MTKRTVYGWRFWRYVENQRKSKNTNQMERWHLIHLHREHEVKYLTRWLARHIASISNDAHVTVSSNWIDQYPQARTRYQLSASQNPLPVNVELADLLLVVKVQDLGNTTHSERATLLQAKCVTNPDSLDRSSPNTSTQNERHLLEACCEPLRVVSGSKKNSPPINKNHATYDLGASPTQLGLNRYARYLLVPKSEMRKCLPYMTVWPSALCTLTGSPNHLSDVVLGMAEIGTKSSFKGAIVDRSTDWGHLVDDLIDYCNRQPKLNRFKSKTGRLTSRKISCSWSSKKFYKSQGFTNSYFRNGSAYQQLLMQTVLNENGGKHPPSGIINSQDKPFSGFTLIQITISTTETFESFD